MKAIEYIKQHPIISAIIVTVTLLISVVLIVEMTNLWGLFLLSLVWSGAMMAIGILFIIAVIMVKLKKGNQDNWKNVLLACLWVLVVGLGCCGGVFAMIS
ncbi:MAG: hypothetical protein KGV56_01635 [Gammaproteobacteria bacterium]|nr:hypothetical protein [Gammaproteobacteria bacterium]